MLQIILLQPLGNLVLMLLFLLPFKGFQGHAFQEEDNYPTRVCNLLWNLHLVNGFSLFGA